MSDEKVPMAHPGEFLKDELEERQLSAKVFANLIGTKEYLLQEFLDGKRLLRLSELERLGQVLGTSFQVWWNLQRMWKQEETK